MGIRETINRRPVVASALTALGVVLVLGAAFLRMKNSDETVEAESDAKAFFTVDDGATYFVDDGQKLSPFQKDGKTAYRAQVFTCDNGKTKFVGYLERYTPEAMQIINDMRAKKKVDIAAAGPIVSAGKEIKAPRTDQSAWIKRGDPRAPAVLSPKCPDGSSKTPERVTP